MLRESDFSRARALLKGLQDQDRRSAEVYVQGQWEKGGYFRCELRCFCKNRHSLADQSQLLRSLIHLESNDGKCLHPSTILADTIPCRLSNSHAPLRCSGSRIYQAEVIPPRIGASFPGVYVAITSLRRNVTQWCTSDVFFCMNAIPGYINEGRGKLSRRSILRSDVQSVCKLAHFTDEIITH